MLFTPDGKPFLAYGSPGGATIINSVVNITINLIDHKMTLQQAIDAGRISVRERRLRRHAGDTGSRPPPHHGLGALGYTVSSATSARCRPC